MKLVSCIIALAVFGPIIPALATPTVCALCRAKNPFLIFYIYAEILLPNSWPFEALE